MRKLFNIRLKDIPNARLIAIKTIRYEFNLQIADAKDKVDAIIAKGELSFDGSHPFGPFYELFDEDAWFVERIIKEVFDCEIFDDTPNIKYEEPQPDPETALALNWYDGLSDEEKHKIDLIGKWKNPILICSAGSAAFGGLNAHFD